tara:strand:+ start:226 stop:366 length:141 start_codon:yes stop_codon:yes gene_type:complete
LLCKYSSNLTESLLLKKSSPNMTNFGGNTAFVLLAKIKGKEDKVTE